MNIIEIITDSLMYPINNLGAVVLYAVMGIVAALVLVFTGVGISVGAASDNLAAAGIVGVIGIIIAAVLVLLIEGYALDGVKYGISRNDGAPGIDFARQVVNGIKLIVVNIVYFLIPILLTFLIAIIFSQWITQLACLILFIIFGLAEFMAECRLAKTDSLNSALSIGEAIGDISRVGILKLVVTLLAVGIISGIITYIINAISGFNSFIGAILLGIFGIYIVLFSNRATGLLYSDV